jgi:hypothetical protein
MVPRYNDSPHALLQEIINQNRNQYAEILQDILKHKDVFQSIKTQDKETDPLQPVYNNGFLPGLDILGIYTIIAKFKPAKYIEIGSGNSTKVAYKSIKENSPDTEIISIDPQPRAEIDKLANQIIRRPFEEIDLNFILDLKENDILFVDNSHRILPNSDSMVFFLEILPRLNKGVIVHIHDIYLPYDYPQFMCDRFYSEQYGLAINLLANKDRYTPLLPNYFISQDKELSSIIESIWDHPSLSKVEHHGGSFWLRIQ